MNESKLIVLRFLKKKFQRMVYELGYVGAIQSMNESYKWDEFKNEIMQWYDFEILGFRREYSYLLVGMSSKMRSYNGMTLKYWG